MAKKKRLTNKQKKLNAEVKKELQEKGVIPPDKPKLNRKQFIEEAKGEHEYKVIDQYNYIKDILDA